MTRLRQTHSLATLPISKEAYQEIKQKLLAAAYHHVFQTSASGEIIDMHGIGLILESEEEQKEHCILCGKPCTEKCQGHVLHYKCAVQARGEEVIVKPELADKGRDKNYHITETKVEDF